MLEILPDLGQAQNRLHHMAGQHVESHQLAGRQLPIHNQHHAPPQQQRGGQLLNQTNTLPGPNTDDACVKRSPHIRRQLTLPLLLETAFGGASLDGFDARHSLGEKGGVCRTQLVFAQRPAAQQGAHAQPKQEVQDQGADHHPCQEWCIAVHHRDEQATEGQIQHQG
ncbi:hypothetical protein D3C78_486380 [compost metagenome]